ncbi:hypothetical protein RJ639_026352 [Escallonia herrerae]|uniref:Uncharacterized protein n=1 Tax=Escallonia herrerae TaxID=1293975 RepID=A0AA88UXW0_9ASTE|nr:hypothetical protein RJ639_026352 [Escallonia herrerae]
MAKDVETSKPKHLDPTSEYYLSSQANSGNSLTKDTLKGDNYVAWEQSTILTLKSHNKLAFIDGRITKPDPKSEDFLAWDIDNSMLCLDDKYTTLRTQIINMDPFPNIDRVYAMVMQEESHRGIIDSRDTALTVGFHAPNGARFVIGWVTHNRNIFATLVLLCPASTAVTQNSSPSLGQAQAAATFALPGLTPEQMQHLITFPESSSSGTDSLVGKSLPTSHTWLIDSGASHHMMGNLNFFSSIWDIPPSPVGLPDGLQTNAIKAGSVSLADGITLRHVLYVPNLAVNLIYVSCLATDANYFVAFSHDICVLQDHTLKSTIGVGKMHQGLFVFQPLFTATVVTVSDSESYELWHRRMGHPSN